MNLIRTLLLWGSQNSYIKNKFQHYRYVKHAVKRFMPGEEIQDALQEVKRFSQIGIRNLLTNLGENISNIQEAYNIKDHYLSLLDTIEKENLEADLSLKLTQLGFDISEEETFENFFSIAAKARSINVIVWIDMESSLYTDRTINFYKKIRQTLPNIGLCLQAYLYRTESDILELVKSDARIRLVKGAYKEDADVAYPKKEDVDKNYFRLTHILLAETNDINISAALATHDQDLIDRITNYIENQKISDGRYEFHMLYGIRESEQMRLASEGYTVKVLISYGKSWFPWFMRRLAERPANVGFVLKNLLQK